MGINNMKTEIKITHDAGILNVETEQQDLGQLLSTLELGRMYIERQIFQQWAMSDMERAQKMEAIQDEMAEAVGAEDTVELELPQ